MVRAKAKNLALMGLSDRNVELLKEGKPISFNLKEIGFSEDINIVIFHGKTEEDMKNHLIKEGMVVPSTVIKEKYDDDK
jgi:hypothetical protein